MMIYRNNEKRNALRLQILTAAVFLAVATPSLAAECTPPLPAPNTLAELSIDLLPRLGYGTSIQIDNENFTVPATGLKFTNIDPATGTFTGQIIFSPIRTYTITGKLSPNGSSNFSINFSFRPLIGTTTQYTGAIRAFNDANCLLRYHIAGVYTSTSLSVLNSKFGPAPFSGTGYTFFIGG